MTLSKYQIHQKINRFAYKDSLKVGNFVLDETSRALKLDDKVFPLREKLFLLMCFLAYSEGKLIHRDLLVESIWNGNHYVGQKSLTNAVCMLRRMFSRDPNSSVHIVTISKTGYRLMLR